MKYKSLVEYLMASGVVETGDPKQIEAAKKEYRRLYLRQYKKERRGNKQEITLSLPKDYYKKLLNHARWHGVSVQQFLVGITESYLKKIPVIHHPEQFSKVEVLLAQLHSELVFIGDQMFHELVSPDIQRMQNKIEELEEKVHRASFGIGLEQYLTELISSGLVEKNHVVDVLNRITMK